VVTGIELGLLDQRRSRSDNQAPSRYYSIIYYKQIPWYRVLYPTYMAVSAGPGSGGTRSVCVGEHTNTGYKLIRQTATRLAEYQDLAAIHSRSFFYLTFARPFGLNDSA